MTRSPIALFGLALIAIGDVAAAQTVQSGAEPARAHVVDLEGNEVGTVEFNQTLNGVLIRVTLQDLPQGTHGFHIHEVGACEPPFESAGGHYNPTNAEHGFGSEGGPHAGDMPNLHVPESGEVTFETLNPMLTIAGDENELFDGDGSAVVIHEGADDYSSQPSGAAGGRIACGVIETIGAESR